MPAPPPNAFIAGYVLNLVSGGPINGATVTLSGWLDDPGLLRDLRAI